MIERQKGSLVDFLPMISSRLRETLNELAPKYYEAKASGNSDRASEIFRDIGLDDMGWDTIGSGSGRVVCDMEILGYSDLALKLAIPDPEYDGLSQNKREAKLWRQASDKQQEYLAEVVDIGPQGYWLIMRIGEPDARFTYDWKTDAEYYLGDLVWKEDIRDENIVQINGEPKICDYGVPP